MQHKQSPGFGKRGIVELSKGDAGGQRSPSIPVAAPLPLGSAMRWAAGGIAAVFLLIAVTAGTGGGSLLGGLLGGLLGAKLAQKMMGTPTTTAAAPAAAAPHANTPATNVQRSGFGSTASSSGAGFSSGS